MPKLKLPSDAAIWEGPYSAVEQRESQSIYHAYMVDGVQGCQPTTSLCGRWQAVLDEPRGRYRPRWGERAPGIYPKQRWCEDCRIRVESIRARMDADAIRLYANRRAGKGNKTPPKTPASGQSFERHHRIQAQLWVHAVLFPQLTADSVPVDANIDVEWRCTVRGHTNFIDQPKHIHELLDKKKKVCPLCRAGLKNEPWTKDRVVAFVRSMESYLDQLSPADRYQLLLQTGMLNSGSSWAAPVADAVLHGSGRASHAAVLDLVQDLEPEAKALALFKRLRRRTMWPNDAAAKASNLDDVRKCFEHWCSVVGHARKLEAIRSVCAPSRQRQVETLWRFAPPLDSKQPDGLRQILLDLFPKRGLRLEHIATETADVEIRRVDSILWSICANAVARTGERDRALVGLRDELAKQPHPRTTAKLIEELLSTRHRDATIASLQQLLGPDERDEGTAFELWRIAPTVGDIVDGEDAFRRLMREALPDMSFDIRSTTPSCPAGEAVERWNERTFSEIGEAKVEDGVSPRNTGRQRDDLLPSDRVARVLDVSDRLLFADYDLEAVDYFLASQVAKLWSIAFDHFDDALAAAKKWSGSEFGNEVRDAFLYEAHEVEHLDIPSDWQFRPPGVRPEAKSFPPRLMQRLTAVRLRDTENRGIGNWSLMGGGKTVSAILSAAVLDSKLTVVICPNSTVDGWRDEIMRVFPSAAVTEEWAPPGQAARRFVVLNVEQFQLADSETRIRKLLDRETPELVVLDEVHKFKQRDMALTRRREMMLAFLSTAAERSSKLKVLGLSGTPVINNLMEARSLIELCTLTHHTDLEITPTLPNAMRVHSRLARLGLRYRPDYLKAFDGIRKVKLDVSHCLEHLRTASDRHAAETILMEEKLGTIACEAAQRTVIYSELVTGVHEAIGAAVTTRGLRVGYFNGAEKAGLSYFKRGDVDILIASSALGTGVDGLQHCTNRLIIATLPWTSSDFDQLLGRFFRPKSDGTVGHAEVVVPWTFLPPTASGTGREWSMDEARWRRIQYKSSLADTAVDGVLPEGELRTPEQAFKDLQTWLVRLESSAVSTPRREALRVPLGAPQREAVAGRVGDLTRFHARLASSRSETTHAALQDEPEQWFWYHTEVEEAAASWPFKPVEKCIEWLRRRAERRKGLVVADLGCGLAKVHAALHTVCEVKSFDHVAYNANVTVANVADGIPLEQGSVDAVILSLMLDWQKDWDRCLDEAARILALDGQLLLWETASFIARVGGADQLIALVRKRGLKVIEMFEEKFFGLVAIKT